MDAIEYLRQRARMCNGVGLECANCLFGEGSCFYDERKKPEQCVEIVKRWAETHPIESGITLTSMEKRIAKVYVEKHYLWAARDKDGTLKLYKREPKRGISSFKNTSPSVNGFRIVIGAYNFPAITWDNSPVCLPKMLEKE